MIRQAHTYLAGAVSGTALIGAAVVAFVLLVSVQALRDWPLAGIGGGGDSTAVSDGRPAAAGDVAGAASPGVAVSPAGSRADSAKRSQAAGNGPDTGLRGGNAAVGTPPSAPLTEAPAPDTPVSTPTAGGGPANPPSAPSSSSKAGAGSGSVTQAGGGAGSGSGSGQLTSAAVTDTVNKTVAGVDGVAGGALGNAGVTQVTEQVVSGVAGPESTVGKTVDKVTEAVSGLLGGNR